MKLIRTMISSSWLCLMMMAAVSASTTTAGTTPDATTASSTDASASSTTTTTTTSSTAKILRVLQDGQDLPVWPGGTSVAVYEDDMWYHGAITDYFDGMYTVTWYEDGGKTEVEYYDDVDELDQMVQDAATLLASTGASVSELYPNNTPVLEYFDNSGWWNGIVVDFVNSEYVVEWTDGSTDTYPPGDEMDEMVQRASTQGMTETDPPVPDPSSLFPEGTQVRGYFPNAGGWFNGMIIDYTDGYYTVEWTDGSTDTYPPGDKIDGFVENAVADALAQAEAAFDVYPKGTEVLEYFANEGGWWQGIVVDFLDGKYIIEWTDGSTDPYAPGEEIDTIVQAAVDAKAAAEKTDPPYSPFPEGTPVYTEWDGEDWWGTIAWYEDGVYTIKWTDGETETYDNLDKVATMVSDAQTKTTDDDGNDNDDDPWDMYTVVYKYFPGDGGYYGEVIAYDSGYYTIKWSDSSEEDYSADEVELMVEEAYERIEAAKEEADAAAAAADDGRSGGGKFLLSLLVIGSVGAVTAFVLKRTVMRRAAKKQERRVVEEYKDQPHSEAKIAELPDVI